MNKSKIRFFTCYKTYTDEEITDYLKCCYLGEDLNLELTTDEDYDYAIVINYPKEYLINPYYESKEFLNRVIHFHYEPKFKYGGKIKKFLRNKSKFFYYFNREEQYLIMPTYKLKNIEKIKNEKLGIIISNKGPRRHPMKSCNLNRLRFLQDHLYKLPNYEHCNTRKFSYDRLRKITENVSWFDNSDLSNYLYYPEQHMIGETIRDFFDRRIKFYIPFKYIFQCESVIENGFFTEKIIEPINCECLTFYCGCPNISKFINPECFVHIDIRKPKEAIKTIVNDINDNLWEQKIELIRKEKERIHKELTVLRTVEKIINEKNRNIIS